MSTEYLLRIEQPHTHLLNVTIRLASADAGLELVMPSWTPGSYLIREFPRNVQDFAAHDATGRPLALHGGSGVELEQLRAAIEAGVGKVNISSRVTRALAAGIRETWAEDPEQLDLRRYLGRGREAVQALAAAYIDRCGVAGRASAPGEPASPPAGPVWTAHDTEAE